MYIITNVRVIPKKKKLIRNVELLSGAISVREVL